MLANCRTGRAITVDIDSDTETTTDQNMTHLGIMTAKKLRLHCGMYYTYGGFGCYLDEIRKYFTRTTLIAQVANLAPGPGWYQIDDHNLDIVHLPNAASVAASVRHLPDVIRIAKKILPRMDIVHARMPDFTGIVAASVCDKHHVPVFCQIIADWNAEARTTPFFKKGGLGVPLKMYFAAYNWCEKRVCRDKLVFAQGKCCYEKHRRNCDTHLVVSAAHHAKDLAEPTPRFLSSTRTILTVARLTGVKNHELIINSLAELNSNSDGMTWNANFVGDGPLRDHLKRLAKSLSLEGNVNFIGQVDYGPALWKFYDEADVFVLASRSEGTPKSLLEAMARCVPIVASRVGGIPTLLGDKDERGLMFRDNDPSDCSKKLLKLERETQTRDARVELARSFAANQTVEGSIARMMATVFQKWPHLNSNVTNSETGRDGIIN